MSTLRLLFKSGKKVTVSVTNWVWEETKTNPRHLSWEQSEDTNQRLVWADLDEVVAIVETDRSLPVSASEAPVGEIIA